MTDDRAAWQAVSDDAIAHYLGQRYAEGVELVRAAQPGLPGWRSDLAHLAACLLSLAGRPAEALAELRAAYEAGGWWHRRILVDDDDLAPLRALDGFAELVERSHARATAAGQATRPPLLHRPAGPARGLLVALHGAGQDADDAVAQWRAAIDAGYVLMALDSTQRNTPTYRSWPDPEVADRDVAEALDRLPPADRALPLVTAGFSAGGRQAVRWALAAHPGTPVGFLAVAPAIGPDDLDPGWVPGAVARGLRGRVLLGARDDDVRDDALAALDTLRRAGVDCRLDEVPELGHDFPADFARRLPKLLAELPVSTGGRA
ncbi:hypothetical protein [Plantactinospora sonchi]|uniref:BCE-2095-like N-terminal domain-containing protein n=1 Tax=Plantactinospora sonchi TaxID=1544735 RepID=A0ABU7RQS0_9ACTN